MKNLGKLLFVVLALFSVLRWPTAVRAAGTTLTCQSAFGSCTSICNQQDTPCFSHCQMEQGGYAPQPDGYYYIGSYSVCPQTAAYQCVSPINSVYPYYGSAAGQCYTACASDITSCYNSCANQYCVQQ
jgi:hypothetical protein